MQELHKISNVNEETRIATCSICGENIEVVPSGSINGKQYWRCHIRRLRGHRARNEIRRNEWKKRLELGLPPSEKETKQKLRKKIRGLKANIRDLDELNSLIDYFYTNNTCEICGITQQEHIDKFVFSLSIDHCHETNEIRGYLCAKCNFGIGSFNDSISKLENAITYLNEYNKKIEDKTQKSPPIEGQGNL